jgi:hypothetical protein
MQFVINSADFSQQRGAKLVEIMQEQFPLDREIQRLTEANLQELFDLVPVKSEFELHGSNRYFGI